MMQHINLSDIKYSEEENISRESIMLDPELISLAEDININGQLQPIMLRLTKDGYYAIVLGNRRFKAIEYLGHKTIKAVITDVDKGTAWCMNLSENINRKDLNMLEEAKAIRKILLYHKLNAKQISKKLNMPKQWVDIRLKLLDMHPAVQEAAKIGNITQQDIKRISHIRNKKFQVDFLKKLRDTKESSKSSKRLDKLIGQYRRAGDLKKVRSKEAMFAMQDHIRKFLGNGPATRVLAWSTGEISDDEMFDTIEENTQDKVYIRPDINIETKSYMENL